MKVEFLKGGENGKLGEFKIGEQRDLDIKTANTLIKRKVVKEVRAVREINNKTKESSDGRK